jgi:3-deoxy-D-manno-octulosonic-acid transferase
MPPAAPASPSDQRPTLLYRAYHAATRLALPFAARSVMRKLDRHGVPPERQRERLGYATLPRRDGQLIWFHGASVGESLSALTLITYLEKRLPRAQFLITSGTATSAELVSKRLPPRTRHQFAALDAPGPVARFLDHWRPDAALFVESELWPVTLTETRRSGAQLALVNARLSRKSVDTWRKYPDTARFLLDHFAVFLTQNAQAQDNLRLMGAAPDRIRPGSNLKAFAPPLPVDQHVVNQFRGELQNRPLWIASSTHEGEEDIVLQAHRRLLERRPDLCLLLAPRHPERGDAVEALIRNAGLTSARRSRGETPDETTQVYLADTLGELGTWYALTPVVFLGGSLLPIGGHNPFEVARAGAAVITGPGVHNFSETFSPLLAAGGACEVSNGDDLAAAVGRWLDDPAALNTARDACVQVTNRQETAMDQVIDTLCDALNLEGS